MTPASARSGDVVVVTPSGHICWKRLLLTKLSENGGVDPFVSVTAGDTAPSLSEDQLITLNFSEKDHQQKQQTLIVPPQPAASSFSSLLTSVHQEYEALVAELFDTRKALQDVRQELSQALYQNDAAVRVVARIAQERDTARQELANFQLQASGTSNGSKTAAVEVEEAPATKKRKTSDDGKEAAASSDPQPMEEEKPPQSLQLPLQNDIPAADLQTMIATWEGLHKTRKARQKANAAAAPTKEQLQALVAGDGAKSWHKTSCKGVVASAALHGNRNVLVTAGKDKSLFAYDTAEGVVMGGSGTKASSSQSRAALVITAVDGNQKRVVTGTATGAVVLFSLEQDSGLDQIGDAVSLCTNPVVDVRIHPDGMHVVAASESGLIAICSLPSSAEEKEVTCIAELRCEGEAKTNKYTCGCLHPDGLIYIAGTAAGEILAFDLKGKSLAGTMKNPNSKDDDPLVSLAVSNNGYHIAAAYASDKVCVWDLRKQKILAEMNSKEKDAVTVESVTAVAFDESGKYLAYGGVDGTNIITVKEWDTVTKHLPAKKPVTGIVWGGAGNTDSLSSWWLATCSNKQRDVMFYSKQDGE